MDATRACTTASDIRALPINTASTRAYIGTWARGAVPDRHEGSANLAKPIPIGRRSAVVLTGNPALVGIPSFFSAPSFVSRTCTVYATSGPSTWTTLNETNRPSPVSRLGLALFNSLEKRTSSCYLQLLRRATLFEGIYSTT